ncbi:hypothetical protein K501DRAFT_335080 [Backusella circina FSU 941]|nr:hypothetical protein K501DRAFT_335080 [Backusella circina FSU 941]
MSDRQLTPPPEDQLTTIEYTKKARHGHGQDVTDAHNIRQVAGCLPIDPITKRFLLISSSKNPEFWVIPKGGWETDETQEHAAMRETWEEAGIKGHITHQLGVFVERSKKKIRAHHWIYEFEISEIVKKYPERKKRDRRWFTYEEALLATENNDFIQDAIRMSSISPHRHGKNIEMGGGRLPEISPAVTPEGTSPTQISFNKGRKPTEAFNALRELMENSNMSEYH